MLDIVPRKTMVEIAVEGDCLVIRRVGGPSRKSSMKRSAYKLVTKLEVLAAAGLSRQLFARLSNGTTLQEFTSNVIHSLPVDPTTVARIEECFERRENCRESWESTIATVLARRVKPPASRDDSERDDADSGASSDNDALESLSKSEGDAYGSPAGRNVTGSSGSSRKAKQHNGEHHGVWVNKADGSRANGSAYSERTIYFEANVIETSVSDAIESNVSEVNVSEPNVSKANVSEANVSKANVRVINVSEANVDEANVSEALVRATRSEQPLGGEANGSEANGTDRRPQGIEQILMFEASSLEAGVEANSVEANSVEDSLEAHSVEDSGFEIMGFFVPVPRVNGSSDERERFDDGPEVGNDA